MAPMGPGSRIGQPRINIFARRLVSLLRGGEGRGAPPRRVKACSPAADFSHQTKSTQPVNDTADWKQKYRDSLREMEAEESRWRQIEQALRRLVGRLCAAGMGVNPQLDEELVALAAANRRSAPAEELERLPGPPAPPPRAGRRGPP